MTTPTNNGPFYDYNGVAHDTMPTSEDTGLPLYRPAPAQPIATQIDPMTTDQAREFLIGFMNEHFTDRTFHRYIRADPVDKSRLAGDFAWQMATALRKIGASPCAMCNGAGSVGHAPDGYFDCPECTAPVAQPIADMSAPTMGIADADALEAYQDGSASMFRIWRKSDAVHKPVIVLFATEDQAMRAHAADMSAPTDERAAFERCKVQRGEAVNYEGDGVYAYQSVRDHWEIWKAAWQAARAAAPVSGPSDAAMSDLMPKRAAFIKFCEGRGLDASVEKDAWGAQIFKHAHIQAMWTGWFNAAPSAAPVSGQGASIDTPEFRKLLRVYKNTDWHNAEEIAAIVQHIDSRPRSEDSRALTPPPADWRDVIAEARDGICAGGLAEYAQHERSIVEPHLDGIYDEMEALESAALASSAAPERSGTLADEAKCNYTWNCPRCGSGECQESADSSSAAPSEEVGTLSVFADKEATFGYAYDISTNYEGHKRLQAIDGAKLYIGAAPSPTGESLSAPKTWQQRIAEDKTLNGVMSKEHMFDYVVSEVIDLRRMTQAALAAPRQPEDARTDDQREQDHLDSLAQDDAAVLWKKPEGGSGLVAAIKGLECSEDVVMPEYQCAYELGHENAIDAAARLASGSSAAVPPSVQGGVPVIWYNADEKPLDVGLLIDDVRMITVTGSNKQFGDFDTPLFASPAPTGASK